MSACACVQILRTFRGCDERVHAAVSLFPALPDPSGVPTLLSPLSKAQRALVQAQLGTLAFFDVHNPTGRYSLDMSQPVHRVVLARLLHSSVTDGPWRADSTRHNLRNVIMAGRELHVRDPTLLPVPKGGSVVLDYLHYTLSVLEPTSSSTWSLIRQLAAKRSEAGQRRHRLAEAAAGCVDRVHARHAHDPWDLWAASCSGSEASEADGVMRPQAILRTGEKRIRQVRRCRRGCSRVSGAMPRKRLGLFASCMHRHACM